MKKHINQIVLTALAAAVCAMAVIYTYNIVTVLKSEEAHRMELWAKATAVLSSPSADESATMEVLLDIIQQNNTIPVVLTDSADSILMSRNIVESATDSAAIAKALPGVFAAMKAEGRKIDIDLGNGTMQHLYYSDSHIVRRLRYSPLVQLMPAALFLLFAYVVFSRARRSEQEKVWIGLAKETAHQLGTPISALMGWTDLLRSGGVSTTMVADEMEHDVGRLRSIADRFSKIGSKPELTPAPIDDTLCRTVNYLKMRVSRHVHIALSIDPDARHMTVSHNAELIGWVIENVCKNAVDAIDSDTDGLIGVHLSAAQHGWVTIDISDNGRGMKHSMARRVFDAGFTTKRRGWGLGLTLAHRIIRQYHKGRIFVQSSEPGVGTTVRICLRAPHADAT